MQKICSTILACLVALAMTGAVRVTAGAQGSTSHVVHTQVHVHVHGHGDHEHAHFHAHHGSSSRGAESEAEGRDHAAHDEGDHLDCCHEHRCNPAPMTVTAPTRRETATLAAEESPDIAARAPTTRVSTPAHGGVCRPAPRFGTPPEQLRHIRTIVMLT